MQMVKKGRIKMGLKKGMEKRGENEYKKEQVIRIEKES